MERLFVILAWVFVIVAALANSSHFAEHSDLYLAAVQILGIGFAVVFIWIGHRRNVSFEKQVETGQEQVKVSHKQAETAEKNLFNDRLSRAIEHMENEDNLYTRIGGVSILQSLALASDANSEDRSIIIDILNSFIRQKATPPVNAIFERGRYNYYDWPEAKPREKRKDIELAIAALSKIISTKGLSGRVKRDIQLFELDLRGLHFKDLDLSYVDFSVSNLAGCEFVKCDLRFSDFNIVNAPDITFIYSDFENTYFQKANLEKMRFQNCEFLNNCSFVQANLTEAYFDLPKSFEIIFREADVSGAIFQMGNFDFPERAARDLIFDFRLPPNFGAMSNVNVEERIDTLASTGAYTWIYIHDEWKRKLEAEPGQYVNGKAWWYHHLSREQNPGT